MKIVKKLLAALLIGSFVMSISACGKTDSGKTGDSSNADTTAKIETTAKSTTYEKVTYAYATFNTIPTEEVLATVEEEINKITRDKIGVEVKLMPINITEYASKISLGLQGGEKIDVFESLGDFNSRVATNMAYDLTSIIDTCAPETKAILGEDFLASCVKDGKLYGIPTYKPYALTPMVIYKQDIADELGIDMTKVKSLDDLTAVLRTVKAAHPEMTPLIPVNPGSLGTVLCIPEVDYLTDDYNSPKGVLMGNDMKAVDLYGTEEFAKICNLARTWYNEDLVLQDAATTTSTSMELMAGDSSFCYVASYSYPTADTAVSLQAMLAGGSPLGAVQIGDAYLDTTSINSLSWMVSSTSKVPEAALKFLNLTFSDPDITNLLIYGIEGRDYTLDADGFASYPAGKDATTVPYTAQISVGTLGNFFIMYPTVGTNKDSLVWEEQQNQDAKKSPAMGFSFDSSSVKTEYTSVTNVILQYLPALLCGSVDPATVIPEFRDKLTGAGLDKILEAKQAQLDTWLSAKTGA